MLTLLRMALQVVLCFLLIGAVIAGASAPTGVVEQPALALMPAAIAWLAVLVDTIAASTAPRSIWRLPARSRTAGTA